jgi:hypothetical protein
MNLYLVQRPPEVASYGELHAVVVRASTDREARLSAALQSGAEGNDCWLNAGSSSCEILTANGDAGIICRDFYEA